jgi:hypothetical protein
MRSIAAMLLGLALLAGCSSAPSYKGGPSTDEPHAIVSLGERISLWKVDGKDAWNRTGDTYLSPGAHQLKLRIEYTVDYEGEGNYEWKEYSLVAEEGLNYLLQAAPDAGTLDLPPYKLEVQRHRIPGYGK